MSFEDEILSNAATGGLAQRFKNRFMRLFGGGAIENLTKTDEVYSPIYTGPRTSVRRLDSEVNEEMKTQMRMLQIHINEQTVVMRRKQQARLKAFEEKRGNKSSNDAKQNKNTNLKLERLRSWIGDFRKLSGGLLK